MEKFSESQSKPNIEDLRNLGIFRDKLLDLNTRKWAETIVDDLGSTDAGCVLKAVSKVEKQLMDCWNVSHLVQAGALKRLVVLLAKEDQDKAKLVPLLKIFMNHKAEYALEVGWFGGIETLSAVICSATDLRLQDDATEMLLSFCKHQGLIPKVLKAVVPILNAGRYKSALKILENIFEDHIRESQEIDLADEFIKAGGIPAMKKLLLSAATTQEQIDRAYILFNDLAWSDDACQEMVKARVTDLLYDVIRKGADSDNRGEVVATAIGVLRNFAHQSRERSAMIFAAEMIEPLVRLSKNEDEQEVANEALDALKCHRTCKAAIKELKEKHGLPLDEKIEEDEESPDDEEEENEEDDGKK
jgi:hypothetical protein